MLGRGWRGARGPGRLGHVAARQAWTAWAGAGAGASDTDEDPEVVSGEPGPGGQVAAPPELSPGLASASTS